MSLLCLEIERGLSCHSGVPDIVASLSFPGWLTCICHQTGHEVQSQSLPPPSTQTSPESPSHLSPHSGSATSVSSACGAGPTGHTLRVVLPPVLSDLSVCALGTHTPGTGRWWSLVAG